MSEEVLNRKPETPAKKPVKKGRKHRDNTVMNIVLTLLSVLANIAVVFTLFNVTQFAAISRTAFIAVNVIALLVLLILDLIVINALRSGKNLFYILGSVLTAGALALGGIGTYALIRVNRNIDKITGETTQESVSASLVVYTGEGAEKITDVAQLDGGVVGFATGTNAGELGKNQITARSINASFEEYTDYSSVIIALLNGEIDCAILPTNYVSMFQNEAGLKDYLDETASILDFEETFTITNTSGSDKDITKEPFTVLLIGNADGLSDTMILCSVNPISMTVTMSSLARDSYVPITCYGGNSSKLNASHAVSRDCTIATIEKLVGVEIDYYVDTNFQGVVDIVDALGGILINSPIAFVGQNASAERGHYTVYVPAGENKVNGEQALAFARERYKFSTGDFARQEHQQQVIKSIVREIMRTRDLNTFLNVLDAAGNNIQTNLTVSQMSSFFRAALQKANRYYDSEHVENIFDIQNSRVTGYSSGLWDANLKLVLYIYRLWQGSLTATKNFITNNINLQRTPAADTKHVKWSVNWGYYTQPVISAEVYPEARIPSDVPPEVLENTEEGCQVQGKYWYDGSCHDTPFVEKSEEPDLTTEAGCRAYYGNDDHWYDGECHAKEKTSTPKPTKETEKLPEDEQGCRTYFGEDGHWYDGKCNKTRKTDPNPTPGGEPTAEPTAQPTAEPTAQPTAEPTPDPAAQCSANGGTWDGNTCVYPPSPAEQCAQNGGTWDGSTCVYPPSPAEECANNGGTWDGSSCQYGPTPEQECANNGGTWDGSSCYYPTPEPTPDPGGGESGGGEGGGDSPEG